ncbi:MAG: FAD-binding oxidoreductase [Bacteroidota bacterium]
MPTTWYESTVEKIEDQSPTTKRFWLKVPELEAIAFKPGQFVTMDLPIHEKRLKRWRSYSIANPPDGTNLLEFSIVHLEGGLASKYLFNEVKEGTSIRFKGPTGVFTLPEAINKDLVFICTGTGVAPFRSMILDLKAQPNFNRNIHLIFGTRTPENILYREEFEALAKEWPNFTYTVALSRDDSWEGPKGYVHQVYEAAYADKKDVAFYLCGWSNMVDEARERLANMGFTEKEVFYELYG